MQVYANGPRNGAKNKMFVTLACILLIATVKRLRKLAEISSNPAVLKLERPRLPIASRLAAHVHASQLSIQTAYCIPYKTETTKLRLCVCVDAPRTQ